MPLPHRIYNLAGLSFLRDTKLNIGLLGGSFNPAHIGHVNISREVKNNFGFDLVIWLVAKQNPLKAVYNSSIDKRAEQCLAILQGTEGILVSTCEADIGSPYIVETIKTLNTRFGGNKFSWLMGSDGLLNFHKWYKSEQLIELTDIIIIDRPKSNFLVTNNQNYHKIKSTLAKKNSNNIMIYKGRLHNFASSNL